MKMDSFLGEFSLKQVEGLERQIILGSILGQLHWTSVGNAAKGKENKTRNSKFYRILADNKELVQNWSYKHLYFHCSLTTNCSSHHISLRQLTKTRFYSTEQV